MERRRFLQTCGVLGIAGLSGCNGLAVDSSDTSTQSPTATRTPTATATPTGTATPTPEPTPEFLDELVAAIDRETEEWGKLPEVNDISASFIETLRRDGEYTENGLAFLDRLETVAESLTKQNAALAAASTAGFDGVSDADLATVDRWLGSPPAFQKVAFLSLPYEPTGTVAGGLVDSSGDDIRDGFLLGTTRMRGRLRVRVLERLVEPRPVIADMVANLAGEAYTDREISHMQAVLRYWQHKGNPYEAWAQAERRGLLVEATTDGEISETEARGIQNSSSDRLIDAQAEPFGVDPTQSDTAGDGFPDHFAWLMQEEFGFPVHPTEPNVYVEVAAAEGVDHLSDNERERLVNLFANAPGGPIHLHLYEGASDVEPLPEGHEESVKFRADDAERAGLGHHYVLLNDRDLDFDGMDDRNGLNVSTASWIDGSLPWTRRASILAHELGHSFGILPYVFGGVDSKEHSSAEYDSVMNYNAAADFVGYSGGEPFDDWKHMREREFGYSELDVSGLRESWQNGTA